MTSLEKQFEDAVRESKELAHRPDDETLLELYSYYKQAKDGDADGPRPGPFDFAARAKHDAWKSRKGLSREQAMKAYVKLVRHLQSGT
jgi:diazepam-binding inhibitor (GABA receptor modulating acyl-CoA-binding protein)